MGIAVVFFRPSVAITSMLYLILGDMSAALIGVSFGGESVVLRLGRGGRKSAEGTRLGLMCAASVYVVLQTCVHPM